MKNEAEKLQGDIKFLQEQVRVLRKDNEELKNSTQASSEYEKRIKDLENEYKQKSNSSDNILARIKELTCSNLNVGSYESWETSLTRAITTNTQEHINF